MSTTSVAPRSAWRRLGGLGQSVWYDNVARPALRSGLLERLVAEDRVTGGTSNPSIIAEAVIGSDVYDADLRSAPPSESDTAVAQRLVVADIRAACDLLHPVWERTAGLDGYVSLEEEASLAFDAAAAAGRAAELRRLVARPNVMIKLPATDAGISAFRRLTRDGVSVNVTLLFSRARYRDVVEAYLTGLEERLAVGEAVDAIASVASFFVSRVDARIDDQLPSRSPLRGRVAIANARLAYAEVFLPAFTSERWRRLARAGANLQRPLWASTGVKDPAYPPTHYIDELIGAGTVTTVPDATIEAFRYAGVVAPTLGGSTAQSRAVIEALARQGVDLGETARVLEREGVERFARAHDSMLEAIARKRGEAGDGAGAMR